LFKFAFHKIYKKSEVCRLGFVNATQFELRNLSLTVKAKKLQRFRENKLINFKIIVIFAPCNVRNYAAMML